MESKKKTGYSGKKGSKCIYTQTYKHFGALGMYHHHQRHTKVFSEAFNEMVKRGEDVEQIHRKENKYEKKVANEFQENTQTKIIQ